MLKSNSNLHLPMLSNISWEQIDVSQTSPCVVNLACPGLSFRGLVNWRRVDFGHVRRVLKWSGNGHLLKFFHRSLCSNRLKLTKTSQSTASTFWNFLECSRTTKKIQNGWQPLIHLKPLTSYCKSKCSWLDSRIFRYMPYTSQVKRHLRLSQVSRHLIFLAWNPMHMRNLREQHLTMRLSWEGNCLKYDEVWSSTEVQC